MRVAGSSSDVVYVVPIRPGDASDAVDALAAFPPEESSLVEATVVTKHLAIEREVRGSSPAESAVPRSVPVRREAEAAPRPERTVEWMERRERRPVVKPWVVMMDAAAALAGEIARRWPVIDRRTLLRPRIGVRPVPAALGGIAVAVSLGLAMLVAIVTPRSLAGVAKDVTGETDILLPASPPVAPVLSSASLGTRALVVPTPAPRSLDPETPLMRTPANALRLAAVATSGVSTARRDNAGSSEPSARQSVFVGALAIDSEPAGAVVFLNQQPVGETPLRLTGLSAGSRVVRIEHEGYERWTAAVLVAADKQALVNAHLQSVRSSR